MTKGAKWDGAERTKSVKPTTSNSQRGHTKRANSPLKLNTLRKSIKELIFEKSTFEVGGNSKTKPEKPKSLVQK